MKIARLRQAETDAAQPGMAAALVLREPPGVERGLDQRPIQLMLVDVERADGHGAAAHPFDQFAIDVDIRSSSAAMSGGPPTSMNSERYKPFPRPEGSGHVLGPPGCWRAARCARVRRDRAGRGKNVMHRACRSRARRLRPVARAAPIDDHLTDSPSTITDTPGGTYDVVQADDGRDAERARKDGGMARPAARVGGAAADARPVQLRHHRWREFAGDEHARRVEVLKEIAGSALLVAKVHTQPAWRYRAGRLFALVQVGVVDVVEHRGDLVQRKALHGPLGVDSLLHDDGGSTPDEHRIVEHQHLRVSDRRQVRSFKSSTRRRICSTCSRDRMRALIEGGQLARDAIGRDRKAG